MLMITNMDDILNTIIKMNINMAGFWSNAHGWAPKECAELLSKSRLDRQVSLSYCLKFWFKDIPNEAKEGSLILAWANLGSLIEGSLKLLLSVYYEDYKKNINALKNKKGIQDPDILMLEELKIFIKKNDILDIKWIDYIEHVQQRRNAIHAFKDRNIGTYTDIRECVEQYLELLFDIKALLPYPDDI